MNLIKPSYIILTEINWRDVLKDIEYIGRVAYKSEDKITKDSAIKFIKRLIKNKHLSVIEHFSFSVKFVVDRGIANELVRHRLASFTQQSTRFCDYSLGKFNNELNIIDLKDYLNLGNYLLWLNAMKLSEYYYKKLRQVGTSPQFARSVLPHSLATEIVVTANLREWRLIFQQRTAKDAHPQIRDIMCKLLSEIKLLLPVIFDDIN